MPDRKEQNGVAAGMLFKIWLRWEKVMLQRAFEVATQPW